MRRRAHLTLAVLVAGSAAGAPIVFGTPNQLAGPAAVSRPAVRLKVPTDTPSPPERALAYELVALVNADRVERSLPTLEWHESLWVAANGHSTEMAATGVLQHRGLDGSNAGDRITAAGFEWSAWGENLGAGYTDPASLVADWLNSTTHRDVLRGDQFRRIGVAVVVSGTGTPYWTMVVAS